jgi:hypothetical protein
LEFARASVRIALGTTCYPQKNSETSGNPLTAAQTAGGRALGDFHRRCAWWGRVAANFPSPRHLRIVLSAFSATLRFRNNRKTLGWLFLKARFPVKVSVGGLPCSHCTLPNGRISAPRACWGPRAASNRTTDELHLLLCCGGVIPIAPGSGSPPRMDHHEVRRLPLCVAPRLL